MLVAALLLNYNIIGFYFKGLKYKSPLPRAPSRCGKSVPNKHNQGCFV